MHAALLSALIAGWTAFSVPVSAGASGPAEAGGLSVQKLPPCKVAEMVQRYQLWEVMFNKGRGYSDRTTSDALAWAESDFLRNYMLCYYVSLDTYWLDKIVAHFDRMIANLADPEGDGYLAWRTKRYSVGIVRAAADGDAGDVEIAPALPRDETERRLIATRAYSSPQQVTDVPGATFTVKGTARTGARFTIHTTSPEACEYQVHDGMVTYPIAQFIEAVYNDPALHELYMEKAEAYAALLAKHFFEKWEETWLDLPGGTGLYKFTPNATQRSPDTSLPHNQYLALARTWLVLQAVPGLDPAGVYRDRSVRMAEHFKKNLRLDGTAYVWNYWDPLPHESALRYVEDSSHGTIDVGFAVEAQKRGVVFTEEDLHRFASTYVDVMWNGDKTRPRFGATVNKNKGDRLAAGDWILLAESDPRVWELAWAAFASEAGAPTMAPRIAYVYHRLAGISESERAECRKSTAKVLQMFENAGAGPLNAGFEVGIPGSDAVAGWRLTTWSPDRGGEAKCVAHAYKGQQAIALIGGGPEVNVIAMCMDRIPVAGKTTCLLKAHYQTVDTPRPQMSLLGYDAQGQRVQYASSPGFEASSDWREARWAAGVEQGVASVEVLLRNFGPGTVYWDEFQLAME